MQSGQITVLALFNVSFVCGEVSGSRLVFAPDALAAATTLRENASTFGLPHENVAVLQAQPVATREAA